MSRTLDNKDFETSKRKNFTACLVFSTGECFFGLGFGNEGVTVAEICFNTSMTGYQEILTDLSYAGQIVNFTFPHIGNTGTNVYDNEASSAVALGMICRNIPTKESNWQSDKSFQMWLQNNKIIGIANIDTRRIIRAIRLNGSQAVALAHSQSADLDIKKLQELASHAKDLNGVELSAGVTCLKSYFWNNKNTTTSDKRDGQSKNDSKYRIVAIDYGAKKTIFDKLSKEDHEVLVVPASTSFEEIISLGPAGIFLSNGPGDPLATFDIFGETIVKLVTQSKVPIFGICLGHQLLGLA